MFYKKCFPIFCLLVFGSGRNTVVSQHRKENSVVAIFEPDRVASISSFMQFNGRVPEMKQFTACFRLKLEQLRPAIPIMSYATESFDNELLLCTYPINSTHHHYKISCCNEPAYKITSILHIELLDWNSICASVDLSTKDYTLVVNGDVIARKEAIFPDATTDLKVSDGGKLILGQDQDTLGGSFNKVETIRGEVADLYLTSTTTREMEMIAFTSCKINKLNSQYIILSFHNISNYFTSSNIEINDVSETNSFCGRNYKRRVILTEPRMAEDAFKTCESIGGSLVVPENKNDNEALLNLTLEFNKECPASNTDIIWLGIRFDKSVNDLVYSGTKKLVEYQNMYEGKQAKLFEYQCFSFYGGIQADWSGKWDSASCQFDKCSPCEFKRPSFLKLRGLCKKSYFDREYYVVRENKSIVFLGNHYSGIYKLPSNEIIPNNYGHWELRRFDMPNVRAVMKMEYVSHFPTGRNTWEISNDRCGVAQSDLVLTICKTGEFSCSDGSCIPLSQRCNLEINCPDSSDEYDCAPLILPTKYSNRISPPRDSPYTPVEVFFNIDIYAIKSFELSKFKIETEATIATTWTDKRIRFKNLKEANTLNNIEAGETKPWVPSMEFLGDQNTSSEVLERQVSLLAKRQSEPLRADDQNFGEDEIFLGESNALIMEKKLTLTTGCSFGLTFFPFDVQICSINILMSETTSNYAKFVLANDSVRYLGERKLLEYYLSSVTNEIYFQGLFSGVRIKLEFQNLYMYYMTSAFIPTSIMLLIGGSSFYFPIDDFSDRIMVSLTSLLVEAALFSQISETIPKTAYLKFIDIWFVFCMVELFLVNISLTIINSYLFCDGKIHPIESGDSFHGSSKPKTLTPLFCKQTTNHHRRQFALKANRSLKILFPIILVSFVIAYAAIAFNHLN